MLRSILVINPGSTSTKIAVYEEGTELFRENEQITSDMASSSARFPPSCPIGKSSCARPWRGEFRTRAACLSSWEGAGCSGHSAGASTRSGRPCSTDLAKGATASTRAISAHCLADRIAAPLGIGAYIADPVVVDELWDVSRVAGHRLFSRRSIFHALNQKAVARRWCREKGLSYEKARLIVAHMGGGVSIGLHLEGRVVDVNNALDGEGPFSAERSGSLPVGTSPGSAFRASIRCARSWR